MALSDFFTGATDALEQALLEREVRQRKAMLDELTKRDKESQIADREADRRLRQQAEARMTEALAQQRELQEAAKKQQLAQNLAQTVLPGESNEETAKLLDEFGYSGIIKKTPGVRMPIVSSVKAGLPAALGGEDAPVSIEDQQVSPDRFESVGGFGYQQARAAAADKAASAEAARVAKAEEAQQRRDFEEREHQRDRELRELLARGQQSANAETRALANEMKRLQIASAEEKLETTRNEKTKREGEARQATQTALDSVTKLLDPNDVGKGIGKATGAYEMRGFTQDAIDFNAERDMLVAALTLPNLGALKGPMSDKDVLFVKQLATKLANPRMSEAETRKELQRAKTFLEGKLAATAGTSGVKRYNPQTGRIE